jgi:AmmeMemoRadiSam system protein B/AmmeMemoRadiSam system protein A
MMMKRLIWLLACAGLLVSMLVPAAEPEPAERPPAVDDAFYPGDAKLLEGAIRAYLDDAAPPRAGRPVGLVAPHAGYVYSGQIAADAYRQVIDHDYDVVVILGVNHTTRGFNGVSVHQGLGYRTPLGLAEIDRELAAKLVAADEAFTFEPAVHRTEHSVEVQVPFVQIAIPGVKILPVVVGRPDPALCKRLGLALAQVLSDRRPLIVASTDLSHYPAYDDAVAADNATLEAIATLDAERVRATIRRQLREGRPGLGTCACGEGPLLAALEVARALGAERGCVISYANSGDSPVGDRGRVVGYGAVALTAARCKGKPVMPGPRGPVPEQSLSATDRQRLLAFARSSIERFLTTGTAPLARDLPLALWRRQGVFVTLRKAGQLRGCVGRQVSEMPLGQLVGAMALQAAFRDRRFTPLRLDELDDVRIEISLLTPLEKIRSAEEIVPGRDGVWMYKGDRSAVFLPHVATEQGWDREQLLDRLCLKAGLPEGSWREGADLYTFRAVVFSESGHG